MQALLGRPWQARLLVRAPAWLVQPRSSSGGRRHPLRAAGGGRRRAGVLCQAGSNGAWSGAGPGCDGTPPTPPAPPAPQARTGRGAAGVQRVLLLATASAAALLLAAVLGPLHVRRAPPAAAAPPPLASVTVTSSVSTLAPPTALQRQRANEVVALKLALLAQQVLAAHVLVKIIAVFVLVAPIVYAGGFLYSLITGSPIQLGLLKIYNVVIRVPGAKVTEETSLAAGLLMNAFFLVGVFSFAVVIGLVSEEIRGSLKGVRSGNYPVVTADHTLVLNWNRQSTSLLRKLAQNSHGCGTSLGRELVILAERNKDSMDSALLRSLGSVPQSSGLRVVTREGAPHCVRDLEAVSAARAKTVIVLHPDDITGADAKKAATILSLEAARSHTSMSIGHQRIILQNPQPSHPEESARSMSIMSLVHQSCRGREMSLVEVNGNRNIARLMAQSSVQPGVANIYSSIAQSTPGAPDFYLKECGAALHEHTYQDARRSYPDAVVCGYVSHTDRRTHLNPSDSVVLHHSDRLVVLAHNADVEAKAGSAALQGPSLEALQQRLDSAGLPAPRAKTVVVLGWQGEVADLAAAIEEFAAPGSEVMFVGPQPPADLPQTTPKCSFHHVEGSPLDHNALRRAGVAGAHAVIVGTLDCQDMKAADASTLASLLVVQDLVASSQHAHKPPHIVASIHRHESVLTARHILKDLGGNRLTAELLQPNELVSGMLLQVANEPGLAPALSELIDSTQGQEIYLRRPERYSLNAQAVPFAEVAELVRLRGETALGYVSGDGSLVLAPDADSAHLYTPNSRVVVMAES